jgi:RNA polymerase sigma-70 factor (TIGR02943 family)
LGIYQSYYYMEHSIQNDNREKVFRQWVVDYSDQLYSYCLKRVYSEDLCKDLVQEAFLAAWRNIDAYKGEASVRTWLFIILKSKLIDHFRKSSNKPIVETLLQEHDDNLFFDQAAHWRKGMYPGQWNVDFSNGVEVSEFYKVFRACGKKLKEIQNSVFIMKYVDGLESEEICKVMGITTSNYWVLIHRAKVQLRACLEKNWIQK